MPLFDYRCDVCGFEIHDELAQSADQVERDCPRCKLDRPRSVRMRRLPVRFGIRMAGPSSRTSGARDVTPWGAEHVEALRSGDVEATREVHYDVARRSGISRERARDITATSAEEGVKKTAEHTRTVQDQPGGASAMPGEAASG